MDESKLSGAFNSHPSDDYFFSCVFAGIQDGICILDTHYTIRKVNATLERWYAHAMPLVGKKCYKAYRSSDRACVQCPVRRTLETGQPHHEIKPKCDPSGQAIGWIEIFSSPIKNNETGLIEGVTEYVRDITEKKLADDRQSALSDGLRAVVAIADELISCPNLESVYRQAVELARERLGLDRAAIFINDGTYLRGTFGTDMSGQTTDEHNQKFPASGPWLEKLKTLKPQDRRLVDYSLPYWEMTGETLDPSKKHWIVLTPIQSQHEVIGIFSNDAAITLAPFDKTRQEIVSVFCSLLGAIIERKRSETALQESEERYRSLFDNSLNGFSLHEMIYDAQGNPSDFRFLQVNHAFETLTGLNAAQCIGRLATEVLPGIEKESFVRIYGEVASTGKPIRFEQHSHVLKRVYDIAAFSPKKGQFATIFTDITERKRAESENIRLATAVHQAAEAIMITDPTGTIEYVNPAFTRISGYAREEALGQKSRMLKSGKHPAHFYRTMWKSLLNGKIWMGHVINRRKDGSLYEADLTISPIRDAAGKTNNYVAISRDVTHEEELSRQLRQAQKMEALGRLAGGIAHDFNNLLTTILGYSKLTLDQLPESDPLRADIEQIERASERAAELTRQLLMMSRKKSGEVSRLDLNAMVMEIERLLHRTLGEDIQVATFLDEELGSIQADAGQLQQVFMNLAINARDAMPDGGILSFETRNVDLAENEILKMPGLHPGPHVMVEIRDTGTGIPPDCREHIFEPFYTTKEEGKGTGLGLSTAYGIVRHFDGLIEFDTEMNKGTAFRIYFPQVITPDEQRVLLAEQSQGGCETILVVEDDEVVRNLTVRHLRSLGYKVLQAANGVEGLEVGVQCLEKLHLILSDVSLPFFSGPELINRISLLRQDFKVIYASGFTREMAISQSKLPSNAAILQKPFSLEDLAIKVREALDA
ncbi:MAG TPA: hypothetical protein DCZ95_19420 [Verrucomicrobia bacterium]|nr:MAG: hypothetical protein A2X46_12850 [Lentisphaerae bacterium GWF2_57_35]HBA86258.1 hypothetical protein [Verrucomicrobiota bacterium]